jgi:lysyl-tRNA synthetase class 2
MNAFDHEMVLRIALELNLKKAVVGGRRPGLRDGPDLPQRGRRRHPLPRVHDARGYQAWGDQTSIGALIRDLYLAVADASARGRRGPPAGTVDLGGEWRWLPVYDAVSEVVGGPVTLETPRETLLGTRPRTASRSTRRWRRTRSSSSCSASWSSPALLQPTFLCDYPAIAQPLARPHRVEGGPDRGLGPVIGGVERGTGFSELVDPVVQREVLTAQSLRAAGGDPEAMQLDEDFPARARSTAPRRWVALAWASTG